MEKCLEVAKLLGEENVNRLKDTVTDLLNNAFIEIADNKF